MGKEDQGLDSILNYDILPFGKPKNATKRPLYDSRPQTYLGSSSMRSVSAQRATSRETRRPTSSTAVRKKTSRQVSNKKTKKRRKRTLGCLLGSLVNIACAVLIILGLSWLKDKIFSDKDTPTEKTTETTFSSGIPQKVIVGYKEHTISYGESLTSIANKYGVTIDDILAANSKIKDKNSIYAGDTLKIPVFETQITYENNLPEGCVRGIDISEYQGNIDWNKIEEAYKKGEISYVIIRICESINAKKEREFNLDDRFEENLSECNKRGIPYGFYAFSRGTTLEEIDKETKDLCDYIRTNLTGIKGDKDLTCNPSLPIYMDCFDDINGAQYKMYKSGNHDGCVTIMDRWCSNMNAAGYCPGIYINYNQYRYIKSGAKDASKLTEYPIWAAKYPNKNDVYVTDCCTTTIDLEDNVFSQQVTGTGLIDGIRGNVDVSISNYEIFNIVEKHKQKKSSIINQQHNQKVTTPKYTFKFDPNKHNVSGSYHNGQRIGQKPYTKKLTNIQRRG